MDAIRIYLPWLLSAITIYMTILAGNKTRWAWAIGLGEPSAVADVDHLRAGVGPAAHDRRAVRRLCPQSSEMEPSMSDLQNIADAWHTEWSKAFITQVSESGDYYIKVKFRTMAEMHAAYSAMAKLAAASKPALPTPPQDREETKP